MRLIFSSCDNPERAQPPPIATDHPSTSLRAGLGSTSLTADADGAKALEIRYKACPLRYTAGVLREGEIRATWTSSPSTTPAYKMPLYTYTGQAAYLDDPLTSGVTEGFGLMFYQSRFYDPQLSRFTQADTIVPGGVQGLDRYAAMNNNPVKYSDPSGHESGDCYDRGYCSSGDTWSSIVDPAPLVILVCGRDILCEAGTPGSLDLFGQLSSNVYRVPLGEWEDGVKYSSASGIQELIDAYPSSPVIIVGHSAGADAATLAYSKLSDVQKTQTKVILLDPTMTAGTHNPALPGEISYKEEGSMSPILQGSAVGRGSVFIFDGVGDGINMTNYGFSEGAANYSYVLDVTADDHMELASTTGYGLIAFNQAISALGLTTLP